MVNMRLRSGKTAVWLTVILVAIPYAGTSALVNFFHAEEEGELSNPDCPACLWLQQNKTPHEATPDIGLPLPDRPTLPDLVVWELQTPDERIAPGLQPIRAPPQP